VVLRGDSRQFPCYRPFYLRSDGCQHEPRLYLAIIVSPDDIRLQEID
jgi:hypothetical protein